MARKLVLCSTPSGKPLANKVRGELNSLFARGFERLKDSSPMSAGGEEFRMLSILRDINLAQFGSEEFRLWPTKLISFSSTEVKPVIEASVRGADVFLIHHSYEPQTPVISMINAVKGACSEAEQCKLLEGFKAERRVPENDKIAEMFIDALKRDCMAARVFLISPYFANSRQDHRRSREGLTSRTQVKAFEKCGTDAFFFCDLHSQGTAGLSESHIDNFHPTPYLMQRFKELFPEYASEFVLVSPDAGAAKRTEHISKHYVNIPFIMGTKSRDYAGVNTVNNARVGNLPAARGKFLLLVDDIADTCGTVEKIIRVMADKEDIKGVVVVVSHALLSGNGVSVLDGLYKEGLLLNLITTDSVPRRPEFADAHPWYVEVSLSPRIARYVYSMYMDRSVSDVHLEDD